MTLRSTKLVAGLSYAMIIGMLVAGIPSLSFADDGILEELWRCAAVDDATPRLACYDRLGGHQKSAPVTVSEELAVPPDELGAESLSRNDDKKAEPTAVVARVTKCAKGASNKKYVFYLEGGQVWKQVSDKRLYFKECDFNVTISKDFFGYKMQREGEKPKFRVSRIR